MERKRDVRKGEMGNVSERERGMRMMWKKERKEVKGWDRTVGEEWKELCGGGGNGEKRRDGKSVGTGKRCEDGGERRKCVVGGKMVEREGGKCEEDGEMWREKGGERGEVGEV